MHSTKSTTDDIKFQASREFNEITLKDIIIGLIAWWSYIISRKILVFCFIALGAIGGFLYATFKKDIYIAKTDFVLDEASGGGLGQYSGIASMVGLNIGSGGKDGLFQGDNLLQLYKSRMMVQKSLLSEVTINNKKQKLIDRYFYINNIKPQNHENFFFDTTKVFSRFQDSVLKVICDNIRSNYLKVYKPDEKVDVIQVEVRCNDEIFAKSFNDEIVKNVNDFYVKTKTSKSLQNLKILQHQTDSVTNVMNGNIYNAASITDATPNLNPNKQVLRVPIQRSQFHAEANKAILSQMLQNLELAKLDLRHQTPLIQVIDKPIFPLDKERFGRLKGLLLGAISGGILIIIYLAFKKILTGVINN